MMVPSLMIVESTAPELASRTGPDASGSVMEREAVAVEATDVCTAPF